jgi:diguanylate cyclase (GGDEF)-like protein
VDAVRASDTVTRYGGDEFIVLISDVANDDDVLTVSGKILNSVSLPYHFDPVTLNVTASLGISRCPQDGQDYHTLLKHADAAMYSVKRGTTGSPRQESPQGTA